MMESLPVRAWRRTWGLPVNLCVMSIEVRHGSTIR